jgi:hypothetical protein
MTYHPCKFCLRFHGSKPCPPEVTAQPSEPAPVVFERQSIIRRELPDRAPPGPFRKNWREP